MANFDQDKDWKPHLASLSQDRVRRALPDLKVMQRAALSAANVTGDEHWDYFLSIIQDKVKDLRRTLQEARNLLENSEEFTTSELINQKLAVRLIGREIEALEWVMGLPKEIMEKGDRASELLETIDESSD